MKKTSGQESYSHIFIIAVLLVAMAIIQLFITFRGLNDPMAMDQAQIARQVALGHGLSTKFIRPIALSKNFSVAENANKEALSIAIDQAKAEGRPTEDIKIPIRFDPLAMKDTNNAPLNIIFNAVALRLSGAHNFDSWKIERGIYLYSPDRIIASISLIFFLFSIWAIYHLCKRLFDTNVASITCILLILSDLFLQFSVSGLPQMMMLLFSTLGANYLYTAIIRQMSSKKTLVPIIVSSIFFTLVCLSGWIGVWVFLGFLLFVGIHFKPHGILCLPPIAIFLLFTGLFLYRNNVYSGNPFGVAVFSIYDGITGNANAIMRTMTQRDVPIDPQTLLTHVIGSSLRQINSLFTKMGGIIITPFFFLALLHPFKNKATDVFKWAIFLIWVLSTIGMALYSTENEPAVSGSQLHILTAPFFTAFALALLYVMIGRLNTSHTVNIKGLRPFVIALVILASSAPLIMSLPQDLRRGLATEYSGLPQWPPYYPPGLNVGLNSQSSPDKAIASDQPWAVAWYANRPSVWIPKKKEMFFSIEDILKQCNTSIGGILITPSSYTDPDGIRGVMANYGDFANFVLEGAIIKLFPAYQTYLSSMSGRIAERDPLMARFAHATSRLRLFGPDVMYYSETPVKDEQ